MIARAVVVTVIPAFIAAGVGVESASELAAQAITGPSAVFGADAAWQWALLLAAAGIIFRAGKLVKHIDAVEEDRQDAYKTQASINAGIIARLESLEAWRNETDRVVLEWQIRSGIKDRRQQGEGGSA